MKFYSKLFAGIVGMANISHALSAADISANTTYSTNPRALNYSLPDSMAISWSNSVMVALNGQTLLLKEMIQDHQSRAADLTQKGQTEKAKWETDLANEMQEKSAQVQKSLEQQGQPSPGTNNMKAAIGEVDDRLVFVSAVEARLEQTRQEISAAIDEIRVLSTQISTNKSPEDIAAMSSTLGENQRIVKELHREQFDLELRKLEFRAIWRMMQK